MQSLIRRNPDRKQRRGLITLELILWMPIMIIVVMAIIEFAIILQVNQQVTAASRFGARIASEITRDQAAATNLSNFNQTATANNLKSRIDTYLGNAGLTASCQVLLEHSACVPNPSQADPAGTPCPCGASPTVLPAFETAPTFENNEAYVKVTVCVPLLNNVPNVLSTFGFDITTQTIEHSTVFRVETNNTDPNADARAIVVDGNNVNQANVNFQVNNDDTQTQVTITFSAVAIGNVDNETPNAGLTYAWTTTNGVNPNPTNGNAQTFTTTFQIPGTPGDNITSTNNTELTLRVTDTCNDTDTDTIQVLVQRNN